MQRVRRVIMENVVIERVNIKHVIGNCKYCGHDHGTILEAGLHNKLMCSSCGKYIKILSKAEFSKLRILSSEPKNDSVSENDYSLEHLHFKMDLLLDYFKIKVGS